MLRPGITLYFIRHGETDWNRDQRYQGQKDIPLNATGRGQAARNGKVLASALGERAAGLDYVASPLERACETMQIVRRELCLPPDAFRTDERLKEVHYGDWEGQLLGELPASDPEGFAARSLDAWGWQPRGGESYAAMSQRVAVWLAEVSRDAVVVAHGGVSRALRGLVLGDMPRAEVPILPVPQDKILVLAGGQVSWLLRFGNRRPRDCGATQPRAPHRPSYGRKKALVGRHTTLLQRRRWRGLARLWGSAT